MEAIILEDGRNEIEVRSRIAIATREIINVRSIWEDKVKNSPTWDDCDFQTFYGSETWTLTSANGKENIVIRKKGIHDTSTYPVDSKCYK